MMRKYSECEKETCTSILPKSEDVFICKNDCEKQVNLTVKKIKTVIIWGYVKDNKNCPVENAFVRLFEYKNHKELKELCHTYTDCNGYYQFDLRDNCNGKYCIMVSKCYPSKKKRIHHRDYDQHEYYDDMDLCDCEHCRHEHDDYNDCDYYEDDNEKRYWIEQESHKGITQRHTNTRPRSKQNRINYNYG